MGAISELYCGRISAPTDIKVRADEYDALNAVQMRCTARLRMR